MVFNSIEFLIFFPIVLFVYFILPAKIRYIWLLASSYYFYMCWNPTYVLLLLASTIITYVGGLCLDKFSNASNTIRKICVTIPFIANISILFFFKYFNFAADTVQRFANILHINFQAPAFDVLLPVGISFYTFQALSYTMDVYRKEIYAEKNFARYALFVSFFPQLVAGPIERSKNLLTQLNKTPKLTWYRFREGLLLMLWGFFLKLVISDRIAIFVDTIYINYHDYEGWYFIIATILFAFQVYCDFNGYSTIAMGSAMILGIQLTDNFNAPYLSSSVSEFWRRWHISLSSWFKDYLYIPLGGSRNGTIRKYLNKIVVFLISGLWHGASWTYIIWGFLNGVFQVLEEIIAPWGNYFNTHLHKGAKSKICKTIKVVVTFILIDFSWIFFRSNSVTGGMIIIKSILTSNNFYIFNNGSIFNCGLNLQNFILLICSIIILIISDICKYHKIQIRHLILKQNCWVRWLIFSFSACFILLFGIWGSGYNASNFIYFQF